MNTENNSFPKIKNQLILTSICCSIAGILEALVYITLAWAIIYHQSPVVVLVSALISLIVMTYYPA